MPVKRKRDLEGDGYNTIWVFPRVSVKERELRKPPLKRGRINDKIFWGKPYAHTHLTEEGIPPEHTPWRFTNSTATHLIKPIG